MTTMYKPNTENLNFHEKIQKELSSYIEKAINENGSVAERVVENSYFLMNDTWNINFIGSIENFKEQYDNHRCNYKNLRFFTNNPSVNLEFKYMFYNKLFKDEWSITTIYTDKARFLSRLIEFLNEKYPNLSSLLDLNVEETERKWVLW
ncbi:transposase [Bacillus songklensis]|uniref:Transposase n=1 Tax=Bacillus songklensis TaxID=1069116 RepID=A0ABV8AZM7_9BACI